MRWLELSIAGSLAVLVPLVSSAYSFSRRQLTFNDLTKNSVTMNGAVAGWVSCVRDPIEDWDPLTCEIWVYDANVGGAAAPITNNAVEDECVAIRYRDVVFRRGIGLGQVILRNLDGGETILSSSGIDTDFYACPQISQTRVIWIRDGQVVIYDRGLDTLRTVGVNVSFPHLSGDFVVWQQDVDDASEVWFLDASLAINPPQRLTNNATPDERPIVQAISNVIPAPPYVVMTPAVAWNRYPAGRFEIALWSGSTTTAVTPMPTRDHYGPMVTSYNPTLFGLDQPAIAWTPTGPLEVLYCTTCDGSPSNNHRLPVTDPFLASALYTSLDSFQGGWMVFSRIGPPPTSQFDLGFFELDGAVVTPITDDAELDDVGRIGFRSAHPSGPVVVWRREVGSDLQIFYAPEPSGTALAALLGLAMRVRMRRAHAG